MRTNQHNVTSNVRRSTLYALLAAFCLLGTLSVSAQETQSSANTGTIRLPEVVITGIDRSKVQRVVTNVAPFSTPFIVTASARDRAITLLQQGDGVYVSQPRQAEQLYLQAGALDPENSAAALRSGDAARMQGKFVEAVTAYQQAFTRNPALLYARYQAGILYESHLQDVKLAIEQFRAYLDGGGTDQRVRIWLRDAERKLGGQ